MFDHERRNFQSSKHENYTLVILKTLTMPEARQSDSELSKLGDKILSNCHNLHKPQY